MKKRQSLIQAGLLISILFSGLTAGWQRTNGLTGKSVKALVVNNTYLFAGTADSGVFRSGDSGASWLAVNTGLTTLDIRALAIRGTFLFAGTYGGGMFRSGDNGASWQTINTGISTMNIQAVGGNDSFLFAGTEGGGVCRSSDDGAHWLEVSNGLVHINVFSIGITGTYVFVGTWGGSAFRTADNGINWFLVTNGLFDPRENIIPFCFAEADTFIFTGTGGGGVFRAKDSARVWYPFTTGLPAASTVKAFARSKDTLFAATQGGVFRSIISGVDAQWVAENDGLADTIVISFASNGSTLFAGTDGSGVWRRPVSEPTLPAVPVLSSPGNGATVAAPSSVITFPSASLNNGSVGYGIPMQCYVSLVAVDIRGRSIWNYASSQSPGYHTISLHQAPRTAGPLFLLFTAGDYRKEFILQTLSTMRFSGNNY